MYNTSGAKYLRELWLSTMSFPNTLYAPFLRASAAWTVLSISLITWWARRKVTSSILSLASEVSRKVKPVFKYKKRMKLLKPKSWKTANKGFQVAKLETYNINSLFKRMFPTNYLYYISFLRLCLKYAKLYSIDIFPNSSNYFIYVTY